MSCPLLDSPALAAPRIRGTKFSKERKKQVLTAFLKGTGNSQLLSLSPSSLLDALVLSSTYSLGPYGQLRTRQENSNGHQSAHRMP